MLGCVYSLHEKLTISLEWKGWGKRKMTSGVTFRNHTHLQKETIILAAPLLTFSPSIHRSNKMEKAGKCYLCRNVGRGFRGHSILRLRPNKLQWIKIVQVIWRNTARGPLPSSGSPDFKLIPSFMTCFGKMAKIKDTKKGFNFSFTKTFSIVSKIYLSLQIKRLCKKLICKCTLTRSLLWRWAMILWTSQRLWNASAGSRGSWHYSLNSPVVWISVSDCLILGSEWRERE